MPPKPKLPSHLPKTWKYSNRNLKPALSESSREAYKERIITPKIEPLWSRGVHFATYVVCAGYPPPPDPTDCRSVTVHHLFRGLWNAWTFGVGGKFRVVWLGLIGVVV